MLPYPLLSEPRGSGPIFKLYAISRVSGPILMFCPAGLIFSGTEGVRSLFHVLRFGTNISAVLSDPFSSELSTSSSVFMFCAPGLVFGYTEGVRSHFHIFLSHTRFQRN
jgi:hypothetical protein